MKRLAGRPVARRAPLDTFGVSNHNPPVLESFAAGAVALALRIFGLGIERPYVKALGVARDSIAATTVYFGFGVIFLLPVAIIQFAANPAIFDGAEKWLGAALISGVIYTIAFHAYVYGMSIGEVSFLSPLYASMFVFLYAMDVTIGEANLAPVPVAGILAVALGIIFISAAPGVKPVELLNPLFFLKKPGAAGMLVYSFGLALGRMVDKSAADIAPPVMYALIDNLPCVIFGIVFLALRGRLVKIPLLAKERTGVAIIGAFAGMYAYVFMLVALRHFNPSVIEPVSQLSVFIAIWLGGRMFGERVKARYLPAALVVAGAAMVTWG